MDESIPMSSIQVDFATIVSGTRGAIVGVVLFEKKGTLRTSAMTIDDVRACFLAVVGRS